MPVGYAQQDHQLLGAAPGSQDLCGGLQPAHHNHGQDWGGRAVRVDRGADPSRLRPDQLWPSVQQPQQPGSQVSWDEAGITGVVGRRVWRVAMSLHAQAGEARCWSTELDQSKRSGGGQWGRAPGTAIRRRQPAARLTGRPPRRFMPIAVPASRLGCGEAEPSRDSSPRPSDREPVRHGRAGAMTPRRAAAAASRPPRLPSGRGSRPGEGAAVAGRRKRRASLPSRAGPTGGR